MADTLTTLRAALEALEFLAKSAKNEEGTTYYVVKQEITDLRALIASIEAQEPVDAIKVSDMESAYDDRFGQGLFATTDCTVKLYTHAQPSEAKAGAVATTAADHVNGEIGYCTFHSDVPNGTHLYATPQARQTTPLPAMLKVVRGDICCKSLDMDQSYGMWVPVTYSTEHGFVDGTCFYTTMQPSEPKAEPTRSQKLRDAGYTRRPKGFDKEDDAEPVQGPVDKGPWCAGMNRRDEQIFIESEDFTHDVRLYVDGDFATKDEKYIYACGITTVLNASSHLARNPLSDEEILMLRRKTSNAAFTKRHNELAFAHEVIKAHTEKTVQSVEPSAWIDTDGELVSIADKAEFPEVYKFCKPLYK